MNTSKIYLEHANITVNNLKSAIHFFQTAFPHFKIRGGDNQNKEWIHLGDDHTYIAIFQAKNIGEKVETDYDKIGINHIGFVVQDVEGIANNLLKNGYKREYDRQVEQFRIRDKFLDSDGNEYEFIQYLSDKIEEKNSYDS